MNQGVSVIIPAYNADKYVEQSIRSALDQGATVKEVIVIDDGSIDETAGIVRRLAETDRRVILLQNAANRGTSYSRNAGLRAATGEWIAILDADDFFAAGRVAFLLAEAQRQSVDMIADNIECFGEGVEPYQMYDGAIAVRGLSALEFVRRNIPSRKGAKYGYLQPVIRADFVRKHKLWYDEAALRNQDFVFYLECMLSGARVSLVGRSFYHYRVGHASLSSQPMGVEVLKLLAAANLRLLGLSLRRRRGLVALALVYRQGSLAYCYLKQKVKACLGL
jgi:glycosyltransferase involved in cell wall biosynthesis